MSTIPFPFHEPRIPCEPDEVVEAESRALRALSLKERGRLVAIACRTAARLDRCRRNAGFPEPILEPWPQSTWDYLHRQAPHVNTE
jgi:hypothetical protein